ncbi:MAG: sulfoxide reductase heme-binding subunit YedZ, partial [Gemmobacter sp.]|nr:sulfoxide reductase heme-binding subunit YedZ [Gemmobacter sp.]
MEAIHRALRPVRPWMVYALGAVPAALLIWQVFSGDLGVDPVKTIEHRLGEVALQLLVAGLCVTPLRRFAGLNLIRFRRQIGVLAF